MSWGSLFDHFDLLLGSSRLDRRHDFALKCMKGSVVHGENHLDGVQR